MRDKDEGDQARLPSAADFGLSASSLSVRLAFEKFAIEPGGIWSPIRSRIGIVLDRTSELVHFCIEIIEVVQGDRFGRHRQPGAAELVGPVMAQNHVFEPES